MICGRGVFRFLFLWSLSQNRGIPSSAYRCTTLCQPIEEKSVLVQKAHAFLYLYQQMFYLRFKKFEDFVFNSPPPIILDPFCSSPGPYSCFLELPCLCCQLFKPIHACSLVTWLPAALDRLPIAAYLQPSMILWCWWFPFPFLFYYNSNPSRDRKADCGFLAVPAGSMFFICLKELASL